MLPRQRPAVRPPPCKLLGFPALSNSNSPPQLIALSTTHLWYSPSTVLQSTALYQITKRTKTKHRDQNFTSVSPLLKYPYNYNTLHMSFSTCHICRSSSPTAFTPLGPDLVGQVHMESSLCHGNTSNDIHDYPGAKQFGMKVEIGLILMQALL